MFGRGADATGATAVAGTAAFRLALVVFEDEESVGAEFNGRAGEGLIGSRAAPVAQTVFWPLNNIIVGTHRLVGIT